MTPSNKIIALAAVAALGLTACSGDDDAGDATVEATGDEAVDDAVDQAADDAAAAAEDALDTDVADATAEAGDVASDVAAETGTIVDVASEAGTFGTLVAALQATGLDETLAGDGPFTVFAPSDQAFVDSLGELDVTLEELLTDPDTLSSILTYHVVDGTVDAAAAAELDGQSVATVNGADLAISVDGDTVMVNDAAVVNADIEASNGIIHVIDAVLMPPTG